MPEQSRLPPSHWRLIVTPPLSGSENMAIDEALLRSFDPEVSPPLLRLYGWAPPAISIGRFQNALEVLDLERCRADRIEVVRRISGGGTIYHADELTYSLVCAPWQIPAASSVKESFRVLTGFLLPFYREVMIEAAFAADAFPDGTRFGERTPFCFAGRESFDIIAGGRKIGGNAQRRLKGAIFQHGSIPLKNHAATGLRYMRDQSQEFAEGAASLADFGVPDDLLALMLKLQGAFCDYFGVTLRSGTVTTAEQTEIGVLLSKRYRTDIWNMEGDGL